MIFLKRREMRPSGKGQGERYFPFKRYPRHRRPK
jgi:hypothetical protein